MTKENTINFIKGFNADAKSVKDYIRRLGFEVADVRFKKGWVKATVNTQEVIVYYKDRTDVYKNRLRCFKASKTV